jgi:hypothetical protein
MEERDLIWIEVNLKINFFEPESIMKGLLFVNSLSPGTSKEFVELWENEEDVPDSEYECFIAENGYPVEIVLTMEMINPDEPDDVIAYTEEIGWFNDIDEETLTVVSLKQVNNIIQNYEGKVYLLVDEFLYNNHDQIIPELDDDLVIITYPFEEEIEE